ncbi:MAG: hypothetical protein JWN21_1652 [Sphingomonas bacterium]|uniref:DUF6916 family protein n=1 Tax=Sphingomonas bacterium TaxID=1895847 RepID=UPI0026190E84|nr:hypothetical protein [Sphingomonas bacterium]MDB5696109.1 hypothetical protein [Sphingomonas bacterium]
MTHEHFAPALGERFDLADGTTLTLAKIETSATGSARPFALVFHGDAATLLPQQIHALANATLGELEIFLVPVAQAGERVVYEAVFN